MKKTIFLAFALIAFTVCFSQSKKEDTAAAKAGTSQPAVSPIDRAPQYFILVNQSELQELFTFVANADIYSEKGRNIYLEFLKKHTYLVPQKDSVPAADDPKTKPKK